MDTTDGGETLVAQYQTQSFLIYGRGKTGQIDLPQDLRGPYWTTYINAVPLKGGTRYLWVSLSYGDRIDPLLLKQLKQLVLAAKG